MNIINQTFKALISVLIFAIFFSCGVINSVSQVTDKDGNVYKTVNIENQEWMVENLNVEHYRNGDVIPQVQDNNQWYKMKIGAGVIMEMN